MVLIKAGLPAGNATTWIYRLHTSNRLDPLIIREGVKKVLNRYRRHIKRMSNCHDLGLFFWVKSIVGKYICVNHLKVSASAVESSTKRAIAFIKATFYVNYCQQLQFWKQRVILEGKAKIIFFYVVR